MYSSADSTDANDAQTVNPIQGVRHGSQDAFIAEFDSALNLIFATYFGSSTDSLGQLAASVVSGLALDNNGTAYIAGETSAVDFLTLNPLEAALPPTAPPFIASAPFLIKIDSGGHLQYSTYLGATLGVGSCGVAVDGMGNALLKSCSVSNGVVGGTIAKLNSAGSAVVYAVHNITGLGNTIAVDNQGNAYTDGLASALVNPIQSDSGFELIGLDPNGNIVFSTKLGNQNSNIPRYISADSQGNVYVLDLASTLPLPLLNGANGTFPPVCKNALVNCGGINTVDYVAKIASGPGPSFSMPGTIRFSSVLVGSTSGFPIVFNIYNTGTTNIAISGISISPGYSQTNNCPAILTPTALCTFTANFSPLALGPQNGAITIADDSPGSPHVIQLTGFGGPIESLSPQSLTFSSQPLGTTSDAQLVTLANAAVASNNQPAPLNIAQITVSGDFSESNNCGATLQNQEGCMITITFRPTITGVRTGTLTITDNAVGSPHTVNLSGLGGPNNGVPVVSLNPQSLTFTSQLLGTTSDPQMVTLANVSNVPLSIMQIAASGDFAESNNCGGTLQQQEGCTITVTFNPTAASSRTGTLTITDNAAGSPHTVSLSGIGLTANLGLGVPSGSSSSATVPAGATANYTLAIGGQGISGTSNFSCTGAPKAAICSVPASVSIDSTTPSPIMVTVTTTARSSAFLFPHNRVLNWMWAVSLFGIVLLPTASHTNRLFRSRASGLLLFVLLLALCSCGGGTNTVPPSQNGTPAGTYKLQVTATVGANTQTTELTLLVQ